MKKQISSMLKNLQLPQELITFDMQEEQVFLRLFDIKNFGCSKDIQMASMWLNKEQHKNVANTITSFNNMVSSINN
jgi:hypothetical protein